LEREKNNSPYVRTIFVQEQINMSMLARSTNVALPGGKVAFMFVCHSRERRMRAITDACRRRGVLGSGTNNHRTLAAVKLKTLTYLYV
jgi:hypothetical protein